LTGRAQSHRRESVLCEFENYTVNELSYLDMLLQVLGTLERLATELTLVRLQRNVNTDVRGDVITLDCGSSA
jgi:hypothetical protein